MIKLLTLGATLALATCTEAVKCPAVPPTVVVTGCEHFGLITASRQDTAETRQQIVAHNAEYLKTCKSQSQPQTIKP